MFTGEKMLPGLLLKLGRLSSKATLVFGESQRASGCIGIVERVGGPPRRKGWAELGAEPAFDQRSFLCLPVPKGGDPAIEGDCIVQSQLPSLLIGLPRLQQPPRCKCMPAIALRPSVMPASLTTPPPASQR